MDLPYGSSPRNVHHLEAEDLEEFQAVELELPFPELENLGNQHRVDMRPYQLSAHGRAHAVKERIIIMPLKEPRAMLDVYEKPLSEPPQRMPSRSGLSSCRSRSL